jgi:hypothetical protein
LPHLSRKKAEPLTSAPRCVREAFAESGEIVVALEEPLARVLLSIDATPVMYEGVIRALSVMRALPGRFPKLERALNEMITLQRTPETPRE